MRRFNCLVLLLIAIPAIAFAQATLDSSPPPPPTDDAPEGPPPSAPPSEVPLPPPSDMQATVAPPVSPQPVAEPDGQWVSTSQYGWLWIPYGQQYTYIPGDVQVFPDQFVYYPAYGWRWVVAPWVYGYGPSPYWGSPGPRYFAWYARPWFRVGGHWGWGGYRGWGTYRGWIGPRSWGARGWAEAPVYYRSGVGGPHPARAAHPEPGRHGEEHERHGSERSKGEHREGER